MQIAPPRYGGHAAPGGPSTILRLGEPDRPDIVHLEQLSSARHLGRHPDVEHYAVVVDRPRAHVDPPATTGSVLTAIRAEY